MYHSKSDENVGHQHSITLCKGQIKPVNQLELIKLRDLNSTKNKSQIDSLPFKDTLDLVEYLRKPERAVPSKRRWHTFHSGGVELEQLEDIKTQFIPESPSLEHTLQSTAPCASAFLKESSGVPLNLSVLTKFFDGSFDCPPFFHTYDYESRLEAGDFESVLFKIVDDEAKNTKPVFQRELEYQELKKFVSKADYARYYIFGIDKSGFFKLKNERELFKESALSAYTSPLKICGDGDGYEGAWDENANPSDLLSENAVHEGLREVNILEEEEEQDLSIRSLDIYV